MKASWKNKDTSLFLEKMEMYDSAGLSLDKSLALACGGLKKHQANSIGCVIEDVVAGGSLSRSLRKNIGIPNTVAALIEHGEVSGRLNESLGASREILERSEELKRSVLGAMIYPVMIATCATALVIGLMRGVMPQITPMLKSLNRDLPFLTKAVMAISEFIFHYGLATIICLIVSLVSFASLYNRNIFVRRMTHRVLLGLPIFGNLIFRHSLSVFLYSFGKLFSSGMSLENAYERSTEPLSFIPLRDKLKVQKSNIARGISVSKVLSDLEMPAFIVSLAEAGESSGSLDNAACRGAAILEKDMNHDLKRLASLLEPALMVLMGGAVGAIALSIMMPIYDISKTLQR